MVQSLLIHRSSSVNKECILVVAEENFMYLFLLSIPGDETTTEKDKVPNCEAAIIDTNDTSIR